MGSEYKECKLGDIANFTYGKMPKKHLLGSGDYITYSGYRYLEAYPEMNASSGDLIVVARGVGGTGDVKLVVRDCYLTNLSIKISLNNNFLMNEYFYYIFKGNNLKYLDSGSAQSQITISDLSNVNLKIPSIGYQKLVVTHLKRLDEKIVINNQINQTLEQMAQTLFKSWFVDFDPVIDNALDAGFFEQDLAFPEALLRRVEVRKVARESCGFKSLPEDIRKLFPAAFEVCAEPSLGLDGWVPEGWEISTTEEELAVKGGSTPSTTNPEFWEGGDIHWTSPKDLSGSKEKIMLDTERKITEAGLKKITSGLLPIETILMSSRAPIGYLALTKIPVAINQGYIAIPSTKRLSQEYVLYWLNCSIDEIKSIAGGTTFAEISKKTFKSISMIVPDIKVIDIFTITIKSYLSKIALNVEERFSLEILRDTLLPKLISGELSLSDIKIDSVDDALA